MKFIWSRDVKAFYSVSTKYVTNMYKLAECSCANVSVNLAVQLRSSSKGIEWDRGEVDNCYMEAHIMYRILSKGKLLLQFS